MDWTGAKPKAAPFKAKCKQALPSGHTVFRSPFDTPELGHSVPPEILSASKADEPVPGELETDSEGDIDLVSEVIWVNGKPFVQEQEMPRNRRQKHKKHRGPRKPKVKLP